MFKRLYFLTWRIVPPHRSSNRPSRPVWSHRIAPADRKNGWNQEARGLLEGIVNEERQLADEIFDCGTAYLSDQAT